MVGTHTQRLLWHVCRRAWTASLGRAAYWALLVGSGGYALALVAARLLALVPDVFSPTTMLIVPAAALLVGAACARRPSPAHAARLADAAGNTRDLFLTATCAQSWPGGYDRLVARAAENRARRARPDQAVRFAWRRRALHAAAAMAVVGGLWAWLPQLDPFGREADRKKRQNQVARLDETRKATEAQALQLAEEGGRLQEDLEKLLKDLREDLRNMRPGRRQANQRRLDEYRQSLNTAWKKLREKKLAEELSRTPMNQRFGAPRSKRAQEWRKQVRQGDLSGLRKEIEALRKQAADLENLSGKQREAAQRELAQRLQELSEFVRSELNHAGASQALQRALEQLGLSGVQELSSEALQAMQQSLELSQSELAQLERMLKNLEAVKGACEVCALAEQLNAMGKLQGQGEGQGPGQGGAQALEDYKRLYRELMARAGRQPGGGLQGGTGQQPGGGRGTGMRGPGVGEGNVAPEDETVETDYKDRKSPSALTAGKHLLEWQTRGIGDPGKAREAYQRNVRRVKQDASEAILREEIPPAYHEAVKQYFDALPEAPEEAAHTDDAAP